MQWNVAGAVTWARCRRPNTRRVSRHRCHQHGHIPIHWRFGRPSWRLRLEFGECVEKSIIAFRPPPPPPTMRCVICIFLMILFFVRRFSNGNTWVPKSASNVRRIHRRRYRHQWLPAVCLSSIRATSNASANTIWKWTCGVSGFSSMLFVDFCNLIRAQPLNRQMHSIWFIISYRRWKPRNIISCMAMRWQLGDHTLQSCGSCVSQTSSVHVSWRQRKCICEKYATSGWSVDGRLQRVLLRVGAAGKEYTIRQVSRPRIALASTWIEEEKYHVFCSPLALTIDLSCVNDWNANRSNGTSRTFTQSWQCPRLRRSAVCDKVYSVWIHSATW